MNKFDLSKFLTENKLTQLGRLTEMGGDPMERFLDDLHANVAPELIGTDHEQHLIQLLDDEGYQIFDEFGGEPDGLDQATKYVLGKFDGASEGYMGTDYQSSEDMAVDMAKKGIFETEEGMSEVEEDYSKYNSVEELMKEIETSTNEAAMKHKMDRVKKAYESIEAKANSLEEGEHASFIAPAKIKEMRRSCKELRVMHEKLLKEYEKKYAKKKIVEKTPVGEGVGFQIGPAFKVGDYVRVGEGNSYDDWVYPFFGYVKSIEGDLAVVENEDGVDIYDVHVDKMELTRR